MESIDRRLRDEYHRWRELMLDTTARLDSSSLVGTDDVLRAHFLLCDHFLRLDVPVFTPGPRDPHLLASAIGRQSAEFGGVRKWTSDHDKVGTLFYGLVKNHPFHDGNKRTALLVALLHLRRLDLVPTVRHTELETLAIRTASGLLRQYAQFKTKQADPDSEVWFLGRWFHRNTRRLNKRQYLVTFRQLDGILKRFGFELAHPKSAYIDVVTREHRNRGWIPWRRAEPAVRTVCQVAFPGWTKQVNKNTLARIRKATGLTDADNRAVDADVFFRGAEPLKALIDEYEGPLKRLRNK